MFRRPQPEAVIDSAAAGSGRLRPSGACPIPTLPEAEPPAPPPPPAPAPRGVGLHLLLAMVSLAVVSGAIAGAIAGRVAGGSDGAPTGASSPAPAPTPFVPAAPPANLVRAAERATASVVTVIAESPRGVDATGSSVEETSAGTGIVLGEDGLILTNFHVISGASRVRVILPTGESREASFVADDSPFQDMALISIPAGGLMAATLGSSSSLRLGEPLLAVASGVSTVQNQVKAGVVSALDVDLVRPGVILTGMIQTDAAVNHGDSGGALVNASGEVVGILTTIVREQPSGDIVEGVALCHAIDRLRPVIDAVRTLGSNPRPRLGIERYSTHHRLLTAAEATRLRLRPNDAVVVTQVEPGSPAAAAGIRVGDIILAVGQERLSQAEPFVNLIGVAGGNEVRLTIVRDGVARQVAVTPRPVRGSQRG